MGSRSFLFGALGALVVAVAAVAGLSEPSNVEAATGGLHTTDVNCDDTRLTFTSASVGDTPIDLLWDFGDGTTATGVHTSPATVDVLKDYGSKSGEFTVKLTASNNLGSDETELLIDISTLFATCP